MAILERKEKGKTDLNDRTHSSRPDAVNGNKAKKTGAFIKADREITITTFSERLHVNYDSACSLMHPFGYLKVQAK